MPSPDTPHAPNTPVTSNNFIKNKINFSRKTWIIVAIVFALIGAFLIWRSFAATPEVVRQEAENMALPKNVAKIVTNTNTKSGKQVTFSADLNDTVKANSPVMFPNKATSVSVVAYGNEYSGTCSGRPYVGLKIDGKTVMAADKAHQVTGNWASYSADIPTDLKLDPGTTHTVQLLASNVTKKNTEKCSRLLAVDTIVFYGANGSTTPVPTVSLGVSPTTITAGSSATLTWSSSNVKSCTASGAPGAWSGAIEPNKTGTQNTGALSVDTTYNLSCVSSDGKTINAAPAKVIVTQPQQPSGGGTGGNGTLLLDAIFDANLTNYPTKYFRAGALTFLNARQEKFHVTTADSLAGNEGHYRADILTKDIYKPGVPTCTTVTVQFPEGLATVPRNSWLQFAEAKTPKVDYQAWNMGVSSWYNGGANSFTIGFQGFAGNGTNLGSAAWVSPPMDNAIHNFSVCTNNAADNTGSIDSIWMDGVRQTFNQGAAKGKQSLSGFPIVKGATTYPLVINNYTGGSPVPVTLIHGAPLISTIGSDGRPPMPPGGWRSF
jgi:hypothetical protein